MQIDRVSKNSVVSIHNDDDHHDHDDDYNSEDV